MSSNRTILSINKANLLESLLAKYGEVVDFEKIFSGLKKETKSRQEARNLVSELSKDGWLVRIKQGLYVISSLESRGNMDLSVYAVAQLLENQSYVSFEGALQYHGMFDQHLRKITSITSKKRKQKEIQGIEYIFIHAKKENFTGWEEKWEHNYKMQIAAAEKALVDLLALNRSFYSIDLVLEKLREYGKDLDMERFINFAKMQSLAAQRVAGFLLDKAGIDSSGLLKESKKSSSASFMAKDSKDFNAKWRLYIHNHFV